VGFFFVFLFLKIAVANEVFLDWNWSTKRKM